METCFNPLIAGTDLFRVCVRHTCMWPYCTLLILNQMVLLSGNEMPRTGRNVTGLLLLYELF